MNFRRHYPLVLMPMVVAAVFIGASIALGAPASAHGDPCGTSSKAAGIGIERLGSVVIRRVGDRWCAFTEREGAARGKAGYTRVEIIDRNNRSRSVVDTSTRYKYQAGPVYLKAECAYARGVIGRTPNSKRYVELAGPVCVNSTPMTFPPSRLR